MASSAPLEPLSRRERWFRSVVPGVRLCAVAWPLPAGAPPPRAALLFVHGYAHYCAPSYDWLATMLAPRGVACFALEHVGHGKSEGLRAYIPSFDGLVEDLLRFASAVRAPRPAGADAPLPAGTPLFAYGESLGGGMCVLAALRAPLAFSGLALFAPMTGLAAGMAPPLPLVLLGQAAALVAPTAPIAPVRDVLPLCFRDAAMLAVARADPNRYTGRARLRTSLELKAAVERIGERGAALALPLFVAHGTADAVTSHAASERLLEACASRDKTFVSLEGAWHVLWAEPADTRARLLEELAGWIESRSAPSSARAPAGQASAAVGGAGAEAEAGGAASASAAFRRISLPLSTQAFGGAPGAATTVFSWATHAHLVTRSAPEGELALPAEEEAASAARARALQLQLQPAGGAVLAQRLVALGAAAAAAVALAQGLVLLGVVAAAVAGAAALQARWHQRPSPR